MGEEHLQELGRNSKVQQGSRDQLKAPSRRSSQEQRKSVLYAVGSTSRTQPQKGSWTVYHAPPKKERGFTNEQHRNSEQGQRASRTSPHVLLACWDFLETGEKPASLSPIESVAFSAFMPDMEEAWARYLIRVASGAQGGRPKSSEK